MAPTHPFRSILVVLAVIAICVSGSRLKRSGAAAVAPIGAASPLPVLGAVYDPSVTQKKVEFYAACARRDPKGAIIRGMLASAYLQRCRETGDISDATRSEAAARDSLKIRSRNNSAARSVLAQSLLMQHRFNEALSVASSAGAAGSGFNLAAQSSCLVAEIHVERGDYAQAAADIRNDSKEKDSIMLRTVYARLLEIQGQPDHALSILKDVRDDADADREMRPENAAWFHMRVGDLLAQMGKANEAKAAYLGALRLDPSHYLTLTALTRLCAGMSDWKGVLEWGTKSAEIVPNPEVLALIGDAYATLGDSKSAEEQYRIIDAAARLNRATGSVYDRQRAMFLADHNRNPAEALTLAKIELRGRHDVYAYDTLAWCCYKSGMLSEAESAAQKAAAQGTRDARILYHKGVIEAALGAKVQAKADLSLALQINPHFLPYAPDSARSLLRTL